MSREPPKKPNECPKCGNVIPVPGGCVGMWDGAKPNGAKAGGGMFQATCSACGARIVAYDDLYDETGKIRSDATVQSPLHWQRDR